MNNCLYMHHHPWCTEMRPVSKVCAKRHNTHPRAGHHAASELTQSGKFLYTERKLLKGRKRAKANISTEANSAEADAWLPVQNEQSGRAKRAASTAPKGP